MYKIARNIMQSLPNEFDIGMKTTYYKNVTGQQGSLICPFCNGIKLMILQYITKNKFITGNAKYREPAKTSNTMMQYGNKSLKLKES